VDLLLLHMAHGYLLASFLSPLTNRREDDDGGTLENRLRFPLAVLDAVRAVWPADRPLAVALSATDWAKGGNGVTDAVAIARALKEHGCDLIAVHAGQTTIAAQPNYFHWTVVSMMDQGLWGALVLGLVFVLVRQVSYPEAPERASPLGVTLCVLSVLARPESMLLLPMMLALAGVVVLTCPSARGSRRRPVQRRTTPQRKPGTLTQADKAILAAADALYPKVRDAMDRPGIKHSLDAVWGVVADAKISLAALAYAARGRPHADRGRLREEIAEGRRVEAACAQVAGEPGRRRPIVLAKRRIGIDARAVTLADHQLDLRDLETGMERRAFGALHAVVGPQRLRAVRHLDGLERTTAGVGAGERGVPRRVPVLGQDDMGEPPCQSVDHGHDRVALRHGERAARTEIELRIDDDQHIALAVSSVYSA